MAITADTFFADVAAVFIKGPSGGSFGSGRLIAPNLVLTAGHVVDFPSRESPSRTEWRIRLIKDRNAEGKWDKDAYSAELAWRHPGHLDLALLRILNSSVSPTLVTLFGSYDLSASLNDTNAAGFPEARWDSSRIAREYKLTGKLRIAERAGPFAWTVEVADTPDRPSGWKGMSGASVLYTRFERRLCLLGVVQEIPANFSAGQLAVARVADAFGDPHFIEVVATALGKTPCLMNCAGFSVAPHDLSQIELAAPLAARLRKQIEACERRDVQFRSPHVVAALLQMRPSFTQICFQRALPGAAGKIAALVDKFVSSQETQLSERGFIAFDLEKHSLIKDAKRLALEEADSIADERHLFLAFLTSRAAFLEQLRLELGEDTMQRVRDFAEMLRPLGAEVGHTPRFS